MNASYSVVGIVLCCVAVGCATRVNVSQVHRENLSSASKVFAVAAGDLREALARSRATDAEQRAATIAAEFHGAAENLAGVAGIWRSSDHVDKALERLIENYVAVKFAYVKLTPDELTRQAYQRMEAEWERLQRSAGYAGRQYQKKLEKESQP